MIIRYEKTISYNEVYYHLKHPQINQNITNPGIIYIFILYHHEDEKGLIDEYNLYLSSDNNYPRKIKNNVLNIYGNNFK